MGALREGVRVYGNREAYNRGLGCMGIGRDGTAWEQRGL